MAILSIWSTRAGELLGGLGVRDEDHTHTSEEPCKEVAISWATILLFLVLIRCLRLA